MSAVSSAVSGPVNRLLAGLLVLMTSLTSGAAAASPEERLKELGIELPEPPAPVGSYVTAVTTGNLVFLAGHGPCAEDARNLRGKIGLDRSVQEGYLAARSTGICLLSSLKAEIGDLSRVVRIVRAFGMVNATPAFQEHTAVINGFSDLMVEVFGDKGKHVRAAVGMGSLPFSIPVEVEMVVEVR